MSNKENKRLKIMTTRFKEIEVSVDDIITMPEGIIGFSNITRYVILDFHTGIDTALKWLQAVDCPELAFILIDPYSFKPGYKVNVLDKEMELLKTRTFDAVRVMTIVSIQSDPHKMTTNLLGPVLINTQNCLAIQIVLNDSDYTTSHYILPQE